MKLAIRLFLLLIINILSLPALFPVYANSQFPTFSSAIVQALLFNVWLIYLFSILFKKASRKIKYGNLIVNAVFALLPAVSISLLTSLSGVPFFPFGLLYIGFVIIFLPLTFFDECSNLGKKGVILIVITCVAFAFASQNEDVTSFLENFIDFPNLLRPVPYE